MSPEFTLSHYKVLLARSYEFFRGYEQALQEWTHLDIPHLPERLARSTLIRRDLEELAVEVSRRLVAIRAPASEAEVLGAMYVMEGSSLGGQVICRHLSESLQLPAAALNYYNGYGAQTGKYWQEFKQHLDRAGGDSAAFTQTCVKRAQETFVAFGAHVHTLT